MNGSLPIFFVSTAAGIAFTASLLFRGDVLAGGSRAAVAVGERAVEPKGVADKVDESSAAAKAGVTLAVWRRRTLENRAEFVEWKRGWQQEQEARQRSIERKVAAARARPSSLRLPPGMKWGRCLLVVKGQTRISGRCAYRADKDGGFGIEGPRQIYGGIDYPKSTYMYEERSNDYWANVDRDGEGNWTGYGNAEIKAVHGEPPEFGRLRHHGSCWVSPAARVCLWI